jgi:hypothetical protein
VPFLDQPAGLAARHVRGVEGDRLVEAQPDATVVHSKGDIAVGLGGDDERRHRLIVKVVVQQDG